MLNEKKKKKTKKLNRGDLMLGSDSVKNIYYNKIMVNFFFFFFTY